MKKTVNDIFKKYSSGKLITGEDWHFLMELERKITIIREQEEFIKKHAIAEAFISMELDEYIVLLENSKRMFTCLNELEDYILYNLGESELFTSDEEAQQTLEECIKAIEKSNEELGKYFTEEL